MNIKSARQNDFFEDVHGHVMRSQALFRKIHGQKDTFMITFLLFSFTFLEVHLLFFYSRLQYAVQGDFYGKNNRNSGICVHWHFFEGSRALFFPG